MVCHSADCSSDDEFCWWLGTATSGASDYLSVHCRTNERGMVRMKEAEKQLLQTLNGQLRDLPSVAKIMIQQYQMSAIVLSVIFGSLFLALTGLLAWGAIELIKKYKEDPYYDYEGILMLGGFVGIPLEAVLFIGTIINIIHACAPIASLITSITN